MVALNVTGRITLHQSPGSCERVLTGALRQAWWPDVCEAETQKRSFRTESLTGTLTGVTGFMRAWQPPVVPSFMSEPSVSVTECDIQLVRPHSAGQGTVSLRLTWGQESRL